MPPPFGLPALRVGQARLSRSVGGLRGCFLSSLPLDSILRAFFVCSVLPHGRALKYSAAALHLAHCANGRRCAHSARGLLPALSVPHAGPQLPAAPPGLRPESGCRAAPSVFVGSRQPPVTRGTRHGRCVPRLQGAAALRGRVSGGGGWGARLPGRFYPSGVCRFYRSLVAYGVPRASLCFARGTP